MAYAGRLEQLANAMAQCYPRVLEFWLKVLDGNETIEQDGKRVFRFTTADRIEVTKLIMNYGFGKPVQPLTAAFQEQRHQVLEVRWMPPDPNDRSRAVDLKPGE